MKLLTQEIVEKLPPLGSQESKPAHEVKIVVKFFDPTGSWNWYVTEGSKTETGDWEFFGMVHGFEKELGYFRLSELQNAKAGLQGLRGLPIERDRHYGFNHTLAEVMD